MTYGSGGWLERDIVVEDLLKLNTHTLPLHKTIDMLSQLVRIAKHITATVQGRRWVALAALGRLQSSKVGGDATNVP